MTDTELTPEGMYCMYCPTGTYQKSTTTMTLERGDATLVVKHVPAYVCSHCGDALLAEAVSERLDDAMDAAVAAGGTTVRAYDQEKTAV
jgi:YgiT-type zinc finger domain-containing protein